MRDDLILDLRDEARGAQPLGHMQVSSEEMLHLLSAFDPYGMWRVDIDAGLVYWTEDVFHIHGMEATDGPVDLKRAINNYHPDDRKYVLKAIEETIENKSCFRFVLRIKRRGGGYKLVKSTGKYREREDGTRELFGTFSQFQPRKRAMAVASVIGPLEAGATFRSLNQTAC